MSVYDDISRGSHSPQFVHQLVEQVSLENQDRIAVIFGEHELTYDQLNNRAEALAQAILYADPDAEQIGVSTTRNLEMIVSVLAILKSGKAYLPLDPAYPEHRLQQIKADSALRTCLAAAPDELLFDRLGLQVIASDQEYTQPLQTVSRQTTTAYVLYTSGSTGKPKGVCMGHRPLMNLLQWQEKQSNAGLGTRTLQLAPLSFDVSFQEIFATLSTGGTLMLIDETLRLDLNALLRFIDEQAINRLFLPFVALQYLAETAVSTGRFPVHLREIMTAGEQLKITPQLIQFFSALPACVLFNQYGPTECHVITQLALTGDPANWPLLPTIGQVIDNVSLVVVDDNLTILPDGEVGELCFGGACLAEGYLNQPVLTSEKFIELEVPQQGQMRIYRTGDLGRLLPDGAIEFLGRRDDQVKIRGHRVELGEVEVSINQLPGVKQAVIVAREGTDSQKRLVAYLVATNDQVAKSGIRTQLEQQLPDYMMPSAFVWLDELPKTSSGKVDKKQLPAPERKRPELDIAYRKPKSELEQTIARIWIDLLQVDKVGLDDNFFELGGNSLLAQKTVASLKQYEQTLPVTKLYQFPTVAGIAGYLNPLKSQLATRSTNESAKFQTEKESQLTSDNDVAVIGMAGRFPGASTVDALWELLKQGKETTRFFTDSELDASIPASLKHDPLYVKARGVIEQADQFDAQFFGLTPNVAQLMDPQQRVFLEIAWETLEQTGYLPQHYDGCVGVFAGCGNNTYYLNNVLGHKDLIDQVGAFQVMTLNEKDYIASRTAYQLNLKGPAVSVYSACSTSLLAISQAVQSIRNGQCDLALAGGASITTPLNSGHLYQEGAMLSRDGHCRSFDADAQGTVFSDGAGVVLLKNREAALRDGDTIYAVIKGVGVNNDGGGKGSFTAPSAEGQAGAIAMAIADAGIDPATISYVEAHGTATPLGDPIEIDGLTQAFGEQTEKQYCAIGSIKSNMGHLTQAAGVAGLIKTTLALYHKQIPPSINYERSNPAIDFANSPFFVNTKLTDWNVADSTSSERLPRRAGVSSFGVGGTNVHVVLEEFDQQPQVSEAGRPVQLITWSAKTQASLDAYARNLATQLNQPTSLNLADVAFTLQTTRANFKHRRFVVAATQAELVGNLLAEPGKSPTSKPKVADRPDEVAFLFPGQGSQYLNMGRALYENETVFRQAVDACAELLSPYLDTDIRQVMYADLINSEVELRLKNTRYTQPALFVTEYALAQLWMSWGIEPSVFCGHSVGEFVAAHLAGIFSLADALTLIAARGRMVSELPRGSMLSVRKAATAVLAILPSTISMAAINSHTLCVVAGPDEDIADFARLLDEKEIPNQPLVTSHAFHSAMMDPIVGEFEKIVAGVSLNRPKKPIVSTVTGNWLTDTQATDPNYWATHLRATVRFSDALDTIFTFDNPLLLEVGPGHVTATLARQQAGKKPVTVLAGLANQPDVLANCQSVLTTLGQLYLAGLEPDWKAFYTGQQRINVSLPTYAFTRKRCWVDPVVVQAEPPGQYSTNVNQQSLSNGQSYAASSSLENESVSIPLTPEMQSVTMRKDTLLKKINQLLEDASGIELDGISSDTSFLEIGFDSLLLTQVALTLKKEFGIPVTFRQLTSEYTSPEQLVNYLDQTLPVEVQQPAPLSAPMPINQPVVAYNPVSTGSALGNPALDLIAQQLQLLAKQIELLQGGNPVAPLPTAPITPAIPATIKSILASSNGTSNGSSNGHKIADTADLTPEEKVELKKPFGATARIERQASELTTKQQDFLREFTERYNQKTGKSKAYAQEHRAQMADPRVVSGFRPLTKEIVYPLVVNRSKGSRVWDIDGNEYIDALNGFGSNMFGYQPDWVKEALHEQIERGFEVGPQHELAGEVSQLICELTGADRAALCNTGSEAVLGTMRIARTVTGRSLIVAFAGSYHGIVDEVLVRGTKKLKSFPAAPGIMPEAVQNMLILDYGTDESLQIIRERAHELAAVLVEPVQSRRPEFVPIEFLKKVRAITAQSGTVLIFDEVITGFRTHPGGAQALFGIKADLGSYGKVVGAGLPIGVIAGKREFMDALDGGFWQYGDTSVPEVGVTYFAGTFVRHPLALAAAKASLTHMKEVGPGLQQQLTQKTQFLADGLNAVLSEKHLPLLVVNFGSLWKIKFKEDITYGELLFTLMRNKGIHIWDGFPCFLTEAHTDQEIDTIIRRFTESIHELIDAGFFKNASNTVVSSEKVGATFSIDVPPAPGARLGRDREGNPAWFIPNPDQPGKYLQVELN
ncbi:amino acid adenylation domain-containing protein [Spirosoma sp. KCTC 42546]|uniref:polyketide synthase n=1 Tax=Spirosoma sp. KCTC 42546 TaxID=2520506 RepID=UPI001159CF8E|nr:polyketide synthase [Spirosoma sp. KCTC 42546]QDK79695.1 amino acid adenylation domain-containing protein [Spirosoma sp. KCTC 42546]